MSKKLAGARAANDAHDYEVTLSALPEQIAGGGVVRLVAEPDDGDINAHDFRFWVQPTPSSTAEERVEPIQGAARNEAVWTVIDDTPRTVRARVEMTAKGGSTTQAGAEVNITVTQELPTSEDAGEISEGLGEI